MLSYIVKWALLSLIIIGFIHYFYNYFKTNFTTPKVINLNNNNLPINKDKNKVPEEESVIHPNKDNEQLTFVKTEQIVPEQTYPAPKIVTQMHPQNVSESAVMSNELSAFLNNELKKN